MAKSTVFANKILDHMFGTAGYTAPAAVYVALFNGDPTGSGTEVTGNAYARRQVNFSAASGGSTSNSGAITFPTPTPAGWGSVTHYGIYDALTGGLRLKQAPLTTPVTVAAGDVVTFPVGSIVETES